MQLFVFILFLIVMLATAFVALFSTFVLIRYGQSRAFSIIFSGIFLLIIASLFVATIINYTKIPLELLG